MIKKVYSSIDIPQKRKVKKIITEKIEEKYTEKIPHTKQVYHGPSSSGYCLRCGAKLVDSMWSVQSKDNKYLCKVCWYYKCTPAQREEYRKKAQQGYYSSETYYTTETRTRYKDVEKEVEVEEAYFETKTKQVFPVPIPYDKNNKVYINNLDLKKILDEEIVNITDEEVKKDPWWYGCTKNIDKEIGFLKIIDNRKKVYEMNEVKSIPFNEMIVSEKQELKEFNDIVGFYPNVPAYIQGHPLNMYNNERKNIVEIEKSITIYVNLALDSTLNYDNYRSRGYLIYSLIEYLLKQKFNDRETVKVNLKLFDATYINGETIIQKIDIYYDDLIKVKEILYNILTKVSFYRIVLLDKKMSFIDSQNLSDEWSNGEGFVVGSKVLKELLDLGEDDILIGSPEETFSAGFYVDDDMIRFLQSIDMYEEPIKKTTKEKLVELGPKEVVKKRHIEKLIHVTNKKNVDSIMKNGILSIDELKKNDIEYSFNDALRLEKHRDAICLSVTDVNEYLFHVFQKRYRDQNYVVLEIDPSVLYDEKTKKMYYDYNAASSFSECSETNMEIMFKNDIVKRYRHQTREEKKENEPTSCQAEILYFGRIDPKYIIGQYDLGRIELK